MLGRSSLNETGVFHRKAAAPKGVLLSNLITFKVRDPFLDRTPPAGVARIIRA